MWNIIVLGSIRDENNNIRRIVKAVYELEYNNNKLKFLKIFKWSYINNSFIPMNAEELFKRSYKLKYISKVYEIHSKEIINEISRRAQFINNLVNEEVFDLEELNSYLRKFYIGDENEIENK
ncbi:hypothetical protein DJ526_12775 [Sulfolobus sp. A20-N-G8]|nr:hypothetical protein DJ526_12775 [Sulfolobus sp. A20-N-G8]